MASSAIRFLTILVLGGLVLAPFAPGRAHAGHAGVGRSAAATGFTVFARGLDHPKGLTFSAGGDLYVAESGHSNGACVFPKKLTNAELLSAGTTGAVVKVAANGTLTPVISGLRSVCDGVGDYIGPTAVAFVGQDLYVLQGQSLCDVGQPPNSCLVSSPLLRVRPDGTAIQTALFVAHPSTAQFPNAHEDPFGMAAGPDGSLSISDGGNNTIWHVDPNSAAPRLVDRPLADFPKDPTVTGVALAKDGTLYAAVFSNFPFAKGSGWVAKVAADGTIQTAVKGLTMPIGVAFDAAGTMYILTFASAFALQPFPHYIANSGAVWRVTASGTLEQVVTGLNNPTAMAFGPDGKLYITNNATEHMPRAAGEVVVATVGP